MIIQKAKKAVQSFDVVKTLESVIGYRGLPFPVTVVDWLKKAGPEEKRTSRELWGYDDMDFNLRDRNEYSSSGAYIRKKDWLCNWYYLPVHFRYKSGGKETVITAQNSVMSVTCEKTIVKTHMPGLGGSVKELISTNDYHFSIAGCLFDQVLGFWPEDAITRIHELFSINEPVKLESALSDIFLNPDDRVVITKIDYPSSQGIENLQLFTLECVSDKPIELILSDV